jgi:hypothetical protein
MAKAPGDNPALELQRFMGVRTRLDGQGAGRIAPDGRYKRKPPPEPKKIIIDKM